MDEKIFNERASRLEEVGKVISALPPEIRLEAFGLLKMYVTKNAATDGAPDAEGGGGSEDDVDSIGSGGLFAKYIHDKPADNVRLAVAHLFEKFGSDPFTAAEIETLAADVGITVPSRIDMTLRTATDDGKQLFVSAGRGKFKPTVHGELYLKKTYQVKKGNMARAKASE